MESAASPIDPHALPADPVVDDEILGAIDRFIGAPFVAERTARPGFRELIDILEGRL